MIGKEILNYKIVSLIGSGGMGSVYLAEHKYIATQKAAIKVIKGDMVNDFTRASLKAEAQHLSSLNHQNIVRFLDYHIDDTGNIYLIMEYAEGMSLDKYIKKVTGLIVEEKICPIFEPLLDAVGYAHKHKIIHRDIKPANIIITPEGQPKILDFGIATIAHNEEGETDDLIIGTPSYMSPEQVKGEHLDERSDVYSLGVVLHQMLTGNAPYDTTTMSVFDINKKVVDEPLPRMRSYYKYISEKVQRVVDKATAKEPKDRYASCADFKKALHNAIYPQKMTKNFKIAVAAACLVILGGGFAVWDYMRTKVEYYKDYVEYWGVPHGVGEVSSSDQKKLAKVYRFESSKGKLRRLSFVNSKGNIIDNGESEHNERPINATYHYTAEGHLSHVKVCNAYGAVQYVMRYNDKMNTIVFQYDDEHGTERALSSQSVGYVDLANDDVPKGRVSRWLIEHDENGLRTKIVYAGIDNKKVGDLNNIYGRTISYDEKGRVKEIHYIDANDNPTSTRWGLGIKKFYYDSDDNWIRAEYFTTDGKPSLDDSDGVGVYELEYDEVGNIVRAFHKDHKGNIMLPKKSLIGGIQTTINDEGQEVATTILGTDGNPAILKGSGWVTSKTEYDANGYPSKVTYFNLSGDTCRTSSGYASIVMENDSAGGILSRWFYDISGVLVNNSSGYAGEELRYDSCGNCISIRYFGTDRNPILLSDGKSGVLYAYNDRNLCVSFSYINEEGQACVSNSGMCKTVLTYDMRGNEIKREFYGVDGNRIESTEAVAGWNNIYDGRGNLLERNFFNKEEKACMVVTSDSRYAKNVMTYDQNGFLKTDYYYDLNGNLTDVGGYVGTEYENDARGNILMRRNIDANKKLASGYLMSKSVYDENDNRIEIAYFDRNNQPALNSLDYHKEVTVYNSANQEIKRTWYGKTGNLVTHANYGCSELQQDYDEVGNIIKMKTYGTDRKLKVNSEGWAILAMEYNASGYVTHQQYFDASNKPTDSSKLIPENVYDYDRLGNRNYVANLDGKGNYIVDPKTGWAISKLEFDANGNCTGEYYFDKDEKPILSKDGYHAVIKKYNKQGNEYENAYFGTNNQPINVDGVHKLVCEYNHRGYITLFAYYNKDGQAANYADYFHKIVVTYDELGTTGKKREYFTASGTKVLTQIWNGSEWVALASYLTVDQKTSLSKTYSSDAGSEVFYVNTDVPSWTTWGIPSWCSVVDRTPTSFRLRYDANPSTSERSDYMKIIAGGKEVRINIKQRGRSVATYLKVDQKTSISKTYGSAAGSETFYVSTDASSWTTWGIPTWCTVTNVTSTSFRLNYEANSSTTSRSDYMKIQAGGKEVRIDIKQSGRSAGATYLKVDQKTSISKSYGAESGSETFYVSTDAASWTTWGIPSWCTVTDVTSTSFRLNYSANTSSSSRSDYMKIKAGNKEVRIDIKQKGRSSSSRRSAQVEKITVDHNVYEGGVKGMRIHVKFTTSNMYQVQGYCNAYFYFSDGTSLKDYNQRYYTSDGNVSVHRTFTPNYVECRYNDLQLFMPYDELHMASGNFNLKFYIEIHDNSKRLTSSDWVHFTFSK